MSRLIQVTRQMKVYLILACFGGLHKAGQLQRDTQNLPIHFHHDYGSSAPPAYLRVMELKSDCSNSVDADIAIIISLDLKNVCGESLEGPPH